MSAFLEIKNLTVAFETRSGRVQVIDRISLSCRRGETIAILGESGSGKSVLAGAIMRILDDSSRIQGQVLLDSLDLMSLGEREMQKIRGNRISIIVQNPDSALNPVLALEPQLTEGLRCHTGIEKKKSRKVILEALETMGLHNGESLLKMYPHQFSGGMKQRMLISAALLTRPEILIADEPTKGLDPSAKEMILAEMKKVARRHRCGLIFISHDTRAARQMGNRVAVMYAGEIVEITGNQRFFEAPLHPYSRALLNSAPEKSFHPIPGSSPSPDQVPGGCRFHPRCPYRKSGCDSINPSMRFLDKDRVKCHLY